MGIMDVLMQLNGPEYDEPAPLEPQPDMQPSPPVVPPDSPEIQVLPEPDPVCNAAAEEASIPDVPEIFPESLSAGDPELTRMITHLKKKPRRIRPEWVLALVALLCAMLLGGMLLLCWPYFGASEDPEALPQYHQSNFAPLQVTERPEEAFLEPTIPETEPENPTIPPDPNPYDRYDFQYDRHNYLKLQNVTSYAGIDVSAYQGSIDWTKVKASGIDFAIIRLGYRGYESGKLVKDEYAEKNLEGARDAGLRVGAYFFSQALTIGEVDQEIDFMLEILGERYLDMPIVLDWEIPASTARTAKMDKQTLTDIQLHFCGQMRDRGFQPMIYFNWHQSEHLYDLHTLEDYPFWLALYQDRMTYPWKVEMWQYSASGKVPGIQGAVDLNVYMPN